MPDILMPQLGETVTEGTITKWFKKPGDAIREDEVLFEVSTDKVDTEVPSPAGGTVTEILVAEGETVTVGTVIARVGGEGAATAAPAVAATPPPTAAPPAAAPPTAPPPPAPAPPMTPAAPPATAAAPADQNSPVQGAPTVAPAAASSPREDAGVVLSPVVRRLIAEHGFDPGSIVGTGLGGRITRADVEARIESRPASAPSTVPAAASVPVTAAAPARTTGAPTRSGSSGGIHEPLNRIRRLTGEYMVASKATSPHVLTAIEVDYENIERVRRAHRASWKAAEGFSLTYLPFIARALSAALREYPYLNSSMGEGELIVHQQTNLAIAVDINFEGLLAPVIHDLDSLRLRAVAREIVSIAERARSKQLSADDIVGGTFTITNAGQYGTLMQFPIINQPQVAILSTDGVSRKPVVITDDHGDESIGIHSVGVLALAWDHRAFDGAYAAAFLNRLRDILQNHDWEAELT